MNFFDRQRAARGTTLRLILLFTAAVLAIVVVVDGVVLLATRAQPASSVVSWLIVATAFTALIIAGGTISKTIALRAGGSAVALSVGAVPVDPTTTDPTLRRYVNIVEEMSLASGVPMPRLYVLEREPGINAFAAGYTPADAAITVTGGALSQLNRDELQGVIGHEFSHVLNGDMRLNIRLIGLLNGILLLGLVGLRILAFGPRGGGDRKGGAAPILVIALALTILGFVGRFFASIIQAAVSRQREWLADASAVQFTRQTTGLEGALKKIAGVPTGSAMTDKRSAEEVRHMLFGEGGSSFSALFATHPPLMKRIAALDPSFRPADITQLQERWSAQAPNGLAEDAALGFTDSRTSGASVRIASRAATTPAGVSARVGTLTKDDLAHGANLSAAIPAAVRTLATQPSTAVPLVLSLLVADQPDVREQQLRLVAARLGQAVSDATAVAVRQVGDLDRMLRLPVVSIAAPLLVARPRLERDAVLATLDEMARADGSISLFEYCLTRYLNGLVQDAGDPSGRSRAGRTDTRQAQAAALAVLAALAAAGNADPGRAQHAFTAAVAHLLPGSAAPYSPPATLGALDTAWPPLDALDPKYKQSFVEAMVTAVLDDGQLAVAEAELLRTACALLHCPLPALVA
jgi:Zn-dependent protease with chaperone function